MKNFKIAQPQSAEQVLALLSKGGEKVSLMAGGTDLLTEIKEGVVEPDLVIDLAAIKELAFIRKSGDGMHIGAMTTVADLASDPAIRADYPGLHEAALSVATPQLRNIGTVGGNLCQRPRCWYYRDAKFFCRKKGGSQCFASRGRNKYHAILGGGICHIVFPSDLAPMFIALDAEAVIVSPGGEKTLPLSDFYALPSKNVRRENNLNPNEFLREVRIPPAKKGEKSTYLKFKERETWDFALASAAVKATVAGSGFSSAKIVLGGVAPIPWRLEKVELAVMRKKLNERLIKEAAGVALQEARPMEENVYKIALVETLLVRSLLSLA
jgi:xanthine dehydrogenase YagS FAD-binding subunit